MKKIFLLMIPFLTMSAYADNLDSSQKMEAEKYIKSKFPIVEDRGFQNGRENGVTLDVPDIDIENDGTFEITIPIHVVYVQTGIIGTISFSGKVQEDDGDLKVTDIQSEGSNLKEGSSPWLEEFG